MQGRDTPRADAVIRRAQRIFAQQGSEGANVVIVGHGNLVRAATGTDTAAKPAAASLPPAAALSPASS